MKELKNRDIPYKIYLSEDEMPRYWYNVRADMKTKPAPLLNPGTLKPMTLEEMSQVFCTELARQELDNAVTVPNQIRAVLRCYKEKLFTELFPGRTGQWVPKTLIFAKTDSHADDIIQTVRTEFGERNDFCRKITNGAKNRLCCTNRLTAGLPLSPDRPIARPL